MATDKTDDRQETSWSGTAYQVGHALGGERNIVCAADRVRLGVSAARVSELQQRLLPLSQVVLG